MATLTERMQIRKAFFASLGECITAWAAVERMLFDLFQKALGTDRERSALLFWAFPTFGMRLSYTSMFVTHCLKTNGNCKTKAQKIWKDLNQDLKNMYAFRNNLAHQPASEDKVIPAEDENDFEMIIMTTEIIIPNSLDSRQTFEPIKVSDLLYHLEAVSKIRKRLSYFTLEFPALSDIALQTFSDTE